MNAEIWGGPSVLPISLWDWQDEAVEALRENIRGDVKNQILCSPTGSGKTTMAAFLIHAAYQKYRRSVFVCDRLALIDQASETFDRHGIPHGIIQGDHWRRDPAQRVQVASAQTLSRRNWPRDIDLLVVDEAHTVHKVVADRVARRDCVTLGLTASPFARGLGKLYDAVVNVRTMNQLIDAGYLAPARFYAPSEPDMAGAKIVAGEWTDEAAAQRSMSIVGDAVVEYLRHGEGRKFLAFGCTIKHCEELHRQFMAAGIPCALYTAHTGPEERKALTQDIRDRDSYLKGLISVAALAKGFDVPAVEVIIMCRPLRKSFTEFIQVLGRGLRRDLENPSKVCTVLDHAGNTLRFWNRMQEFFQHGCHELDDGKPKPKQDAKLLEGPKPMKCPACAYVHAPQRFCPACGHEYPRRASGILHKPGTLSPLTGMPIGSHLDKQAIYSGLLTMAVERNREPKWANWKYKQRFNEWPNNLAMVSGPASPELRSWVKHIDIKYAYAKRRTARK